METTTIQTPARPRTLDLVLATMAIALTGLTLLTLVFPAIRLIGFDRGFDIALQSISGAVALGVAALGVSRYRADARPTRLVQAAAWFATFAAIGVQRATVLLGLDRATGFAPGAASSLTPWIALLPSLLVSVLLLAATRQGTERPGERRRGWWLIAVPYLGLFLLDLVLLAARLPLPDLLDPVAVAALRELVLPVDLARFATDGLPAHTAIGLAVWSVPLVILLAGVVGYRRQARVGGPATSGWLAVSVLVLAFAQAQAIITPTAFTGIVSWFDILLLAAVTAAFLGQVAEEQADSARLRRAILAEERLRAARTERAVLDERLRIAREVHDGLSQSVWLLRMRVESLLAASPDDRADLATATREGLGAIEEDARLLVDAMRRIEPADDLARALADVIREVVPEDGPEVRVDLAGPRPPVLAPAVVAELRAVAREALVNVLRHADATLVRVTVDGGGGAVSLEITDNGRGFDVSRRAHGHYGIAGMEERVRALGGTLEVRSATEEGTTIRVTIPVAAEAETEAVA